ncbi:MAG TPA: HAMP domain-containing histidine kinase [Firmicutes bacterium]|nr:HAMP domain-containing histidine kinase [Bacillota bacterium]
MFSKMELGEFPYSPEHLDAVKEIKDFAWASSEEYRRRGLQIKVEAMPDSAIIQADPTYFRSILTNLLDNSAKYKKKAIGTVTITARTDGPYFKLLVEDDGPGIPTQALPKLFDAFYRNDPSRKNPNQGSGLGLAIVAKTMERMGGSICAEILPNGGLRMALQVPLAGGEERETDPNY